MKKSLGEAVQIKWKDVCKAFPNRWVLIEVVQAHTNEKSERILEEMTPLKTFSNSPDAMVAYQELHLKDPKRELYVLHTNRKNPNIIERKRIGVRR